METPRGQSLGGKRKGEKGGVSYCLDLGHPLFSEFPQSSGLGSLTPTSAPETCTSLGLLPGYISTPLPISVPSVSRLLALTTQATPVQCPHQHSVLELLGFGLQLHVMLLQHSPLAQAAADTVCRWMGTAQCSPCPVPPPTQGLSWSDGRRRMKE